jgi:adenylate cyclase
MRCERNLRSDDVPMSLTELELAERAGSSPKTVRRLVDLGILVRGEANGLFEPADVHLVRLMEAFEEAGIDLELIARGIEEGTLGYENIRLFLGEPAARSATYGELAGEAGRSPELLRRLVGELGLPQSPSHSGVRADDAKMLAGLLDVWAEVDDEELARLARTYGENVRRLVASELQLASTALFSRLRRDATPAEMRRIGTERGVRLLALAEELLIWLRRRHLEHELIQATVQNTEEHLQEQGMAPARPRRPPAIAFLDLAGYTRLTEERGDEAAAELATPLAALVQQAAHAHGGHPVKWLGDGVMFHFPEPAESVLAGLDLVEGMPAAIDVRARVGVDAGRVISREGDYFGRTVNVASRIADYARPNEVLVSEEVRQQASLEGVDFEPIGPVALKGLKGEVTLHSAKRRSSRT